MKVFAAKELQAKGYPTPSGQWMTFGEIISQRRSSESFYDPETGYLPGDRADYQPEHDLTEALAASAISAWGMRSDGSYEEVSAAYFADHAATAYEDASGNETYVKFRARRTDVMRLWPSHSGPPGEQQKVPSPPKTDMEERARAVLAKLDTGQSKYKLTADLFAEFPKHEQPPYPSEGTCKKYVTRWRQ